MNYHFLSFVFDVLIWLGFTGFLTKVVNDAEHVRGNKRISNAAFFSLTSLVSGLWGVITRGLPDVGPAWYSFFLVISITSVHALIISQVLRLKAKQSLVILLGYVVLLIKDIKATTLS
jgi:hypothetical protein